MIIKISNLLSPKQVSDIRENLDKASWVNGNETAGTQAIGVKHNQQVEATDPKAQHCGNMILDALAQHPTFISAALPLKIFPPMFNRYESDETYGLHVDNSIRFVRGTNVRIRTDLSATVFLTDPNDYEGGELIIEDKSTSHSFKLNAGDMILYPSTRLHKVTPVTSGARISACFWLQSMIRDHEQREILYDLDQSVQSLTTLHGNDHKDVMSTSAIYHRLIQRWADT
ncbi:MAG: Fe2+-dependent dioxygenase [Robiginitomaculum sp.]|nr:MAG: Fe2+-dependent dioxygenase [Robiginitomaculum sp.]